MVKPFLSISLQDPQSYYMEDETIHCQVTFKSEKALKEALVRIKFMGRSTSLSNSIKQHARNIFAIEKEIPVTANVKNKMNTIEFSLEVPRSHVIPSYRNLEGSGEGGKIEYLIEAGLEASGFLKKSVLATHIISVPLIGNVNINENGLERTRDSTMRWPKNEQDQNTCVLYGWIPHEGILRGKDVPIRIEFKQPERYEPVENITISLVQQEIISSSKDSPPEMTKQLTDRIVKKDEKPAELVLDPYSRVYKTSKVVVFNVPSDITPSITEGGKVLRIDYKIRVTVQVPNGSDKKELSINLPVVVGTVGSMSDSALEPPQFKSETSSSIGNDLYPGQPVFPGMPDVYPPPLQHQPIGPGFINPFNHQFSYPPATTPPPPPQFVLNTQTLPFVERADTDVTRMPIPDFQQYPTNPFLYHEDSYRPLSPTISQKESSTIEHLDSALSRMSTTTSKSSDQQQQQPEKLSVLPILDKPNTPTPPTTPFKSSYYSGLSMQDLNADNSSSTPTRIDPLNSITIEDQAK